MSTCLDTSVLLPTPVVEPSTQAVYDCLRVVAQRLGATLVTLDRRMADAAAELGVAVKVPAST